MKAEVIIVILRTQKAVVTGGSRGIGYEIARRLIDAGAEVVITGRKEEPLRTAAENLGTEWLVWDVADISVMQEKFDRCVSIMGGFDTLVNNAGVLTPQHEWGIGMLDLTETEWDTVMDINLKGAFFMMQTAVRYLYHKKIHGNVLNISSVAATEPGYGPYVTSKCGLVNLTRGWGKFFASHGIVINGIGPGPVATEMNNWHKGDSVEHSRIPTGRFLTVEEVGAMAMYLLSEEANQVIGQTFMIDGAYDIK